MGTKIFAQVSIKPNSKPSTKKPAPKVKSVAAQKLPSKVQLKKAEKKLLEVGCEITSVGPTIGISMEVTEFNSLFGTKLGTDENDPKVSGKIIIPENLKDIIADVAIASLPEYF